ncbi:MAG: hypothetical protein A3J29_10430 [Acidobacteria bacterium RIFCSPLOWO2_12_FULL_67_14b]|nr:MAG: hypothetical protein A3J29_10430 [Acidobacteria bacterium RIFCSPLOWO2_12_FULL_67_14b]
MSLSVQRLAVRQRQDFVARFLASDGAAADKKVEPSAVVPQHFRDDDDLADVDGAAPAAPRPGPHAFRPANDIRLDKSAFRL